MSEATANVVASRKTDRSQPTPEDEFYVGYLATPHRLSRWLRHTVVAIVAIAIAAAALIAALQNDPGDATWTLDTVETWEGSFIARPYPMLRLQRTDGTVRTLLLVGEGKHGVSNRLPDRDCAKVRIKGTLLRRDGREMIELLSTDDGFALISGVESDPGTRALPLLDWHARELRGEIIDPKCFLGAMKPGQGKVHKACAALCLRGGVPPMFVSTDPDGTTRYHLLVGEAQQPVTGELLERVAALVGEPVLIRGQTADWGDVSLLKIDSTQVIRE